MQCLALIIGIITALSARVSASGYTAPQWLLVARNQSALFGYQLVGSQLYNTSAVCKNVSIVSHGVWNGPVDTDYVQRAFCDQIGWDQGDSYDWELIKKNIKFFNTNNFVSQLLYAFDLSRLPNTTATGYNATVTNNPYTYICANLQPAYLEDLNINSAFVRQVLCTTGPNNTTSPPPPANTTALNPTILADNDKYVAILFANLLITSSTTTLEADRICEMSSDHAPGIENTGIEASVVNNVACGRDGRRRSSNENLGALQTWTTKVFLQVLEHLSDDKDWMKWLCGNLDAGAMNVTGLDGEAAKVEVCGGGKVGEGWCSDPYLC